MNISVGWQAAGGSSVVHGNNPSIFAGSTVPGENPDCDRAAVGSQYVHKIGEESAELYFKLAPGNWTKVAGQPVARRVKK